jgi:Domain of unknown function (DUF4392)
MIDHLLALDPGHRGITRFFVPGGAAAAAHALLRARRVLITTGFALGPGLPETDGPPGAAALGRALRMLGKEVGYVTDPATVPLVEAALGALGEPAGVIAFTSAGESAPAEAEHEARSVLTAARPTHLVAIERPGRTRDGDYRSARAESVRRWNGPLDTLFLLAPRRVVTVGIGDGGNEIGMGNVRARLVRAGGLLPAVASVVRVHHLVVAGTSNWGAYGVVAELSRLTGRLLLHSGPEEAAMVEACVHAGAVDGITRRREPTVDGLPLAAHLGMLELLRLGAWSRDGTPLSRPDAPRAGQAASPSSRRQKRGTAR